MSSTKNINTLTVVLDQSMNEEQVVDIVTAIRMVRYVKTVKTGELMEPYDIYMLKCRYRDALVHGVKDYIDDKLELEKL